METTSKNRGFGSLRTRILISFCLVFSVFNCQNSNDVFVWDLAKLVQDKPNTSEINGNPKIVESPFGKAVSFNGSDDAVFLDENPLISFEEFTVEMIFNPAMDGDFEQRIVHMGEVSGDRMLLEIRAVDGFWYFDGFVASGYNKLALFDEKLIHPLGKWHHVALVVGKNSMKTYVNGNLELTESFSFSPIKTGKSSVGVRLNKRSWYKGSIDKIKITPKPLNPESFLKLVN
ncbi:LamG domain-containing protein [Tamlana flava]|uniref:LamG domain-containing protein n=1 Tax=Tamlana flava TaxID=3158572 RepID=UPI00351BB16A